MQPEQLMLVAVTMTQTVNVSSAWLQHSCTTGRISGDTVKHALGCCCRQNQELEQDTLDAEEEKFRLQLTADRLTQRLDAIMKDKFSFKCSAFDADTPIDKTLNFLSDYIGVSTALAAPSFSHLPRCLLANI